MPGAIYGGWSKMQPINDAGEMKQLKEFLNQVKETAQEQAGRVFTALDPLEYSSQVVTGINYHIKAYTGDGWNSNFLVRQRPGNLMVTLTSYSQTKA